MRRGTRGALIALVAAAAAPTATAAAAQKPGATTGAASNIAPQTAALNGSVNPRGQATTYFFKYGPTRQYGAQTAVTPVGQGTTAVKVTAALAGLAPATVYHYRIVAQNATGTTQGNDRTFKTRRQPLGVTLAGTPNPVATGAGTTLAGTLTGTGNAGRNVVLQSNPWPYTQGFLNAANPQVTDASGNFAFPVLSVPVNTQFRVLMPQRPAVASPIVVVGTTTHVTTHLSVHRHRRSGHLHFYGSILPPMDGTQVLVQKFKDEQWKTIATTNAKHVNSARSKYTKWIWNRRGGRYRVIHQAPDPHVPSLGRTIRVRHTRR
jgi:hypothetical protein